MGVGSSRDGTSSGASPGSEPLLSRHGSEESQQPTYSAIDPGSSAPSLPLRRMKPFWVQPLEQDRRKHYYLVKVPGCRKPKILNWRAPRPFVLYDLLLSTVFVIVAVRLIMYNAGEHFPKQAVIGAILFQAGLVAAVMVLYAIFRSCGRRCFRLVDLLIVVTIGISIYLTKTVKHPWMLPSMSNSGTWELFVGISLLVAVGVYVLSRGCFLLTTMDDMIDMLAVEVESMQTSIAIGLADVYFDRVKEAGELIKRAPGRIVSVSYKNPVATSMSDDASTYLTDDMYVPCLFITLPRHIDWREATPTLATKESYIRSGRLLPCRLEGSTDDPWLCVTGIRQGYVLDVSPQPLQRIIDDIRLNPKFSKNEERTEQYQKEIHRFSSRLAWLAMRARLDVQVNILEFNGGIMAYVPSACNEVMAERQYVVPIPDEPAQDPSGGQDDQPDAESGT